MIRTPPWEKLPEFTRRFFQETAPGWSSLAKECDKSYFTNLTTRLAYEEKSGLRIAPSLTNIYQAFALCPPEKTHVVIIGQDPYPTEGVANGLAFSTSVGKPIPASLRNIFTEAGCEKRLKEKLGDLSAWAAQGVLLINSSLTVRLGEAGCHKDIGWSNFVNAALEIVSSKSSCLIVMLWGKNAEVYEKIFPNASILKAPHPSPLSAYRGFIDCGHFTQANEILTQYNLPPINWD